MARHDRDLGLLIAVSRATGGFIFVRLVLGAFGMDLYEIYWWFGAGIAVALSGMAVTTARRTDFFDAAMSDDLPQGGLRRLEAVLACLGSLIRAAESTGTCKNWGL